MKTKCLVCGSNNTNFFIKVNNTHGQKVYDTKNIFTYFKCNTCKGLFLTKKRIDKNYFKAYYSKEYRNITSKNAISNLLNTYSNIRKKRIIENHIQIDKIELLDVGSGDGNFILSLPKKYATTGLEIDGSYKKIYAKAKKKLLIGDFLNIKIDKQKFEVVTAWHSVEHFKDTDKFFKKVNQILDKNGLFIFSVPNYSCLGFGKGRENWFHFDAPRHIVHLNNKSVNLLANKNNFEVIEVENNYYDFPTDLFWSLKGYKYRYLYYILYPIFKFVDKETITYVLRKNNK
jgi:2-polyprenyl-3-methyl-5-hydroxy-6-metoxy-1,4-benzoquinol methylase